MKLSPKSLTRARKNRGLTRRQAAEALGLEPKTIAAWEQGDKQPRPGQLVNLAGLYGCHIDDLACARGQTTGQGADEGFGDGANGICRAEAPVCGQEGERNRPADTESARRRLPATYLQAALALDPSAYDIETPARIQGCPDFYFSGAPRNPGGCGTLDGHCVACWNRKYQGEAPRGREAEE